MKTKLAGMGGAPAQTFVDDVFSTYLYTGNGSTQTITNGIDLAGKGGLVWVKKRIAAASHGLYDTTRGAGQVLITDNINAQATYNGVNGFSASGFSLGSGNEFNQNTQTFASWTFRKAAKFFDVVTYTGNGAGIRAIPHSLGIVAGMAILKKVSTSSNWIVAHNSNFAKPLYLNSTAAADAFNQTGIFDCTESAFYVGATTGSPNFGSNDSGVTYVAYLFAHDTSSTGIIQCGSYTGNGTTNNISLGWEAQYILIKSASSARPWVVFDTMRGFCNSSSPSSNALFPNASTAETSYYGPTPTATGFGMRSGDGDSDYNASSVTYIYMAIRRPNKPPTTGTQVFSPQVYTGNATANRNVTTGFPVDMLWGKDRNQVQNIALFDRLRNLNELYTNLTIAEVSRVDKSRIYGFDTSNGILLGSNDQFNGASANDYFYGFKRAPGFFDVVCYTGVNGGGLTVNHNLTVAPEFIIVKSRSDGYFIVFSSLLTSTEVLALSLSAAKNSFPGPGSFASTATTFTLPAFCDASPYGYSLNTNLASTTYVAYLFATLAGISKVGSYTGNGTSQNIECGFAAGARFVLIKRTDSTGDWYVWDTARGIVSANDPHLSLNTTAAEVTTDDSVDPYSAGFAVNQVAATNINVSSATYVYLSIA